MTEIKGEMFKAWRKSVALNQSAVADLFDQQGYPLAQSTVSLWEREGVPQRAVAAFAKVVENLKQTQLTKSSEAA